jgi:hypothetical protein
MGAKNAYEFRVGRFIRFKKWRILDIFEERVVLV